VEEENDIEDTTILTGTTVSNTPGIYIDGNTSTIDTFINQGKKVIAYFHADRCPTCQALEKDIQLHINNIPSDIAIVKFNYDKEEELKIKYKVQAQNTIVYLAKDKTELASKVG
jgi:thioredoxin-like negative regulator of GroEL